MLITDHGWWTCCGRLLNLIFWEPYFYRGISSLISIKQSLLGSEKVPRRALAPEFLLRRDKNPDERCIFSFFIPACLLHFCVFIPACLRLHFCIPARLLDFCFCILFSVFSSCLHASACSVEKQDNPKSQQPRKSPRCFPVRQGDVIPRSMISRDLIIMFAIWADVTAGWCLWGIIEEKQNILRVCHAGSCNVKGSCHAWITQMQLWIQGFISFPADRQAGQASIRWTVRHRQVKQAWWYHYHKTGESGVQVSKNWNLLL